MDTASFVVLLSIIATLTTTDATLLPWTAWHLAHLLQPTMLLWTARAWRHCRTSLATDVASARSWSLQKQVSVALLVTFLVAGPTALAVLSLAAVAVPMFVTAWTIAVASATSAYGLWIIARLGWQFTYETGASLAS
ncbi:MAG: hypothetical protein OXF79_20995 [Chloroflexi bacterium]|nr:hypothetical protein [Chloroflexota bacterium]